MASATAAAPVNRDSLMAEYATQPDTLTINDGLVHNLLNRFVDAIHVSDNEKVMAIAPAALYSEFLRTARNHYAPTAKTDRNESAVAVREALQAAQAGGTDLLSNAAYQSALNALKRFRRTRFGQ